MDEEALLLSDVYTEMEIEEYKGRYNKKTVVKLNDYKDLFKHVEPQGTRILVKGDPGVGKTTFVQKLALDWATKQLDRFDVVLVVRLKFADKGQSIASMVKDQIKTLFEDDRVSEKDIAEYMKSGRDRVLLVLDGLDEINLKQYPQVNEVLVGERYRKCCILATTRPHVAETLDNKMTSVAKIKGFSMKQAIRFVENFLDGEELFKFSQQIEKRKMLQMHQVPLIVQALALIFKEYKKLPRTYTVTYDELVFFLRKSCQGSKNLTEEEIQAAMDEVNQLAFKGLIREDKKLVFSRDEIKDENVRKLGILTAEKAGSGFNPTEVLQFAHKTVQEHSASDHVVKRLLSDDRGPWEALVEQFHKDASTKDQVVLFRPSEEHPDKKHLKDLTDGEETTGKTLSHVAPFGNTLHSKADLETKSLSQQPTQYISQEFTQQLERVEYNKTLFRFIIGKLANHPAVRDVILKEMAVLLVQHSFDAETGGVLQIQEMASFVSDLKSESLPDGDVTELDSLAVTQSPNKPRSSSRLLQVEDSSKLEPDESRALQVLGREANLPQPTPRKTGRKRHRKCILESQDCLAQKRESLLDGNNDNIAEVDPFLVTPALVHLKPTMRFPEVEDLDATISRALKVSGTRANISEFIPKVTSHIKHLRDIHILELERLDRLDHDQDHSSTFGEFATTLFQSSCLVSMQLSDVDPKLTGFLMQNLPLSVQRLSVLTTTEPEPELELPETFTFPPEVNLVCLQLHNSLSMMEVLFRNTVFLNLKKIAITNDSDNWEGKKPTSWTKEDAQSLLDAVRTGRMSALEELNITGYRLKGFGPELVEILRAESLYSAQFIKAELSTEDGQILLENIQDGNLDVEFLNLMDNDEIGPLAPYLKTACKQHEIILEMSPAPGTDMASSLLALIWGSNEEQSGKDATSDVMTKDATSDVMTKDATSDVMTKDATSDVMTKDATSNVMTKDATSDVTRKDAAAFNHASLVSSFTPEEKQSIRTFISHLTPKQTQRLITQMSSLTPEQIQARLAVFSHSKTQLNKTWTKNAPRPRKALDVIRSNITQAMQSLISNVNVFQVENEAREVQLILGTILNLIPAFVSFVRRRNQQEQNDNSDGEEEEGVGHDEDDLDFDLD